MIRILPFLFGSFIIHTSLVICLEYVNLWPPQAGGSLQGNLDKVFVSVISDEDFTACALSPATRESAASTPLPASPMRQDESTDEPKKDRNISPEPQLLHNVPSPTPNSCPDNPQYAGPFSSGTVHNWKVWSEYQPSRNYITQGREINLEKII